MTHPMPSADKEIVELREALRTTVRPYVAEDDVDTLCAALTAFVEPFESQAGRGGEEDMRVALKRAASRLHHCAQHADTKRQQDERETWAGEALAAAQQRDET